MEPIKLIPLHQGRAEVWANGAENCSVHLTYDVSNHLKSWPDAVPSVAFERADGERYSHAWELDGPVLHIPLLLADTEIPGMCKCMITLLSGDGRANTVVFHGSVTQGIDSLGEVPADPMLGIIEQVNEDAAEAYQSQQAAKESENAAKESETNAKASEDGAQAFAAAALASEKEAVNAAAAAAQHENNAKTSETNAANSATDAGASATAAAESARNAQQNAAYAVQAREAANTHARNAETSANNAANAENAAESSAAEAKTAAENAKASEDLVVSNAQSAANNETAAVNAAAAAIAAAAAAEESRKGAVNAADTAAYNSNNALQNAAASHEAADAAAASAAEAKEALANMEERYYVPSIDDDGYLHFTPSSADMPEIPPVYVRGPVGPAGEGGAGDIFTLHYGSDGKMDKTFAQLRSAVNSKKTPILIDDTDGETMYYLNSVAMSGNTTMSYTFASIRYQTATSRILTGKRITYYATGNVTKGDVEIAARNPERLVIIRGEETKEYYGNSPVSFEIPEKLPTVGKLLLRGAVNADFDGSSDVTVEIPEGGTGGGGGSSADQVQADWNENDTESKAYVQNRTHWKDIETKEIYSSIQFAPMSEDEPIAMIADTPAYFPSAGDGVVVNWNGAEYACTLSDMKLGGISCVACGNLGMLMESTEVTNEPFAMLLITPESVETAGFAAAAFILDGSADVTMTMHGVLETYHKLDYRFIGTKYEQPAWGSESGGETILDTTLTGDPQEVPIMDKFSLVEGKEYIVHWNGAEYKCAARNVQGEITMTGIGNLGVIEGGTDTGEPFVIVALPGGVADEEGYYGAAIALDGAETVSVKIVEECETVHRIPSKFIGDYEQPAWGKREVGGVIFNPQYGNFVPMSNRQYAIVVPINVEAGKKYSVRFNGVDYKVEAYLTQVGNQKLTAFGDEGLVEESATEGDPPFYFVGGAIPIEALDGQGYGVLNVIKETNIEEFIISDTSDIHKIPMEYLGGGAGTHGVVENEIVYLDADLSEFAGKGVAALKVDFSEPLIPGEEYVVDWGGTEYRGIAQTTLDGGVMIGNGKTEGWGRTEEPYTIKTVVPSDYLYDEGYKIVITMFGGATVVDHVKVCRPVGFVKKLDVEYIPRQCCTTLLMTITSLDGGNEGTPTCEANILAEEAADLFNKGMLASVAVKFVDGRIYTADSVKATNPDAPSKELDFYFTVSGQRYEVTYRASGISVSKRANEKIILRSTTSGSTKEFGITVDDSGTLSVTEIIE